MSGRKKILIMCFTSPLKDMRFLREIEFLRRDFDVTVAGAAPGVPDLPFEEIKCRKETWFDKQLFRLGLLIGTFFPFYSRYTVSKEFLKKAGFDLVLCNDLLPLPLAFRIAKGAPVFWDAHEYYPLELGSETIGQRLSNRAAFRLCKKRIPCLRRMSTVCRCFADLYQHEFYLSFAPLVIGSMPYFSDLHPTQPLTNVIRLVHQGQCMPSRRLENLIRLADLLPHHRFQLHFYLVVASNMMSYYTRLKESAPCNVFFHDPVPHEQLMQTLNQYDLGLFMFPTSNFNHSNTIPNKFYENIQARIGLAIGPSPEMVEIVKKRGIGVFSNDFTPESMAETLKKLTEEDIICFKCNAELAAQELCAEKEMPKLVNSLKQLLKDPDPEK